MAVNVNFYAAWEPVRINAGLGGKEESGLNSGFFINATGLQWTSAVVPGVNDEFGGWLSEFLPPLKTRSDHKRGEDVILTAYSLRLVAQHPPALLPHQLLQLAYAGARRLCGRLPPPRVHLDFRLSSRRLGHRSS